MWFPWSTTFGEPLLKYSKHGKCYMVLSTYISTEYLQWICIENHFDVFRRTWTYLSSVKIHYLNTRGYIRFFQHMMHCMYKYLREDFLTPERFRWCKIQFQQPHGIWWIMIWCKGFAWIYSIHEHNYECNWLIMFSVLYGYKMC